MVSSDHPPPASPESDSSSSAAQAREPGPPDHLPSTPVTEGERSAMLLRCDLDVHLVLAEAREVVHASCSARNVSGAAVTRIPLELSSTLRWQTIAVEGSLPGAGPVSFTQCPVATDTDHTGYAQEAVVTLARPLAPGASVALSIVYSGAIRPASDRLQLLGATETRVAEQDWDGIVPATDASSSGLRGFGHVLWYPVSAPLAVLGQGNQVVRVVEREQALHAGDRTALHLAIEYAGDPPVGAIFDGELRPLTLSPDSRDEPIERSRGLATADFPAEARGARLPSLFLTAQHPVPAAEGLLSVLSPRPAAAQPFAEGALALRPLLSAWLGPHPARPLLLLDHPGEPFAEGALLALPLAGETAMSAGTGLLLPALTEAWFGPVAGQADRRASAAGTAASQDGRWIEEGVAGFLRLLEVERASGRAAAIAQLESQATLIALSEPDTDADLAAHAGEPLTSAHSRVLLELKGAAVLWQLRELAGTEALQKALASYRRSRGERAPATSDTETFKRALEQASGKDFGWFFADWIERDRGLPDLTIVAANPRPLPARADRNGGYLVAVEVRNDGGAVADVPVVVRSGALSATERLRIPAHETGSVRVLFEGEPDEVLVNDGSVPELRTSEHTLKMHQP